MSSAEIKSVLWLSLCLTLAACSSGGGGDSAGDTDSPTDENPGDSDPVPAKGAPTVTVESSIKQLQFNWNAQEGDSYYVLSENPGDASGFTDILEPEEEDNTDTTQTIPVAVHHHNWVDAAYIVEACNASDECVPSLQITTEDAMLDAVGYFKASNPGIDDEFGQGVALSGDGLTLAVGAHLEQSNSTGVNSEPNDELPEGPGAVYIFTLSDSGWVQQAYIKPPAVAAKDDFGHSVALSADGGTMAVGSTWGDGSATEIGIVHIFVRNGGEWAWQATVEAADAEPGGHFGISVDLSDDGNLLAVGAPGRNPTGTDGEPTGVSIVGSVYLFTRSGVDWTQLDKLAASNGEAGDKFGFDVALSGDGTTLAAGAYAESSASAEPADNTAPRAGAVYVFSEGTDGWNQQAYLKANTVEAEAHFGYALTISDNGNLLAVGAKDENLETGAVDVFARTESAWLHQAHITASNASGADGFGTDLAFSGDGSVLAVGAAWEDSTATGINGEQGSNTAPNSGAVYLFGSSEGSWVQTAYVKAANRQDQMQFGHSVSLDTTGDTLAVGAIHEDGASPGVGGDQTTQTAMNAGAVYLY